MRLAVIIRSEQKVGLPTAAELRRAGFVMSEALGPPNGHGDMDRDANGRDGADADGPERRGPPGGPLPERQSP